MADGGSIASDEWYRRASDDEEQAKEQDEDTQKTAPAFALGWHPSAGTTWGAGRFITEAQEKRRGGAQACCLPMTLPGCWVAEPADELSLPKAPLGAQNQQDSFDILILPWRVHDTFESRVVAKARRSLFRPFYAFGLLSFFGREYSVFLPQWRALFHCQK